MFDARIYCKMITTMRLVNKSFTSNNYYIVVVMEVTLKLYSHSSFQLYNTVLLGIVTMLFIGFPEIILSYNRKFVLFDQHLISSLLSHWQPIFYSVSMSLMFFDSTHK